MYPHASHTMQILTTAHAHTHGHRKLTTQVLLTTGASLMMCVASDSWYSFTTSPSYLAQRTSGAQLANRVKTGDWENSEQNISTKGLIEYSNFLK